MKSGRKYSRHHTTRYKNKDLKKLQRKNNTEKKLTKRMEAEIRKN